MKYMKVTQDNAIKLVSSIIEAENKKYGLDINFINLSLKDRVKELMRQENFVIKKVSDYIQAFDIYKYVRNTIAFYDSNFDTISLIKDKKLLLISVEEFNKAEMIETAYHEFFHALDKDRVYQFYDFDCPIENIDFGFLFSIVEDIIWPLDEVQKMYHIDSENFLCEMQADLYGIDNTLSKHKLDIKSINSLKKFNDVLLERYENYDSDFFLDVLYKFYQENPEYELFDNQIFDIFYKDGVYKNIDEILNDPRTNLLDRNVLYSFLMCPSFLKTMINGEYNLDIEQYKQLFSMLENKIMKLNNRLDSKKKLNEEDSFRYYFKRIKRSVGRVYKLIKKNAFINERILNPIFKNRSIKERYKKSIADKDEEKLKLANNVYDNLMNNYYNLSNDSKNR